MNPRQAYAAEPGNVKRPNWLKRLQRSGRPFSLRIVKVLWNDGRHAGVQVRPRKDGNAKPALLIMEAVQADGEWKWEARF